MTEPLAKVRCCCGRYTLFVADLALAMEGDKCREGGMPDDVYTPIPPDELETATIDDKPIKHLEPALIRFFRGDHWNKKMLDHAAAAINSKAATNS